jgi:hypothetical protein
VKENKLKKLKQMQTARDFLAVACCTTNSLPSSSLPFSAATAWCDTSGDSKVKKKKPVCGGRERGGTTTYIVQTISVRTTYIIHTISVRTTYIVHTISVRDTIMKIIWTQVACHSGRTGFHVRIDWWCGEVRR